MQCETDVSSVLGTTIKTRSYVKEIHSPGNTVLRLPHRLEPVRDKNLHGRNHHPHRRFRTVPSVVHPQRLHLGSLRLQESEVRHLGGLRHERILRPLGAAGADSPRSLVLGRAGALQLYLQREFQNHRRLDAGIHHRLHNERQGNGQDEGSGRREALRRTCHTVIACRREHRLARLLPHRVLRGRHHEPDPDDGNTDNPQNPLRGDSAASHSKICQIPEGAREENLKNSRISDYIFDTENFTKSEGKTGAYIQYAIARINSILAKAKENGIEADGSDESVKLLSSAEEWELIKQLGDFPIVVEKAANNLDPSLMAGYLYETAKAFSKFYQQCSIMNADDKKVAGARLYLAECTLQVMKNAMNLVLVPYLEKM